MIRGSSWPDHKPRIFKFRTQNLWVLQTTHDHGNQLRTFDTWAEALEAAVNQ